MKNQHGVPIKEIKAMRCPATFIMKEGDNHTVQVVMGRPMSDEGVVIAIPVDSKLQTMQTPDAWGIIPYDHVFAITGQTEKYTWQPHHTAYRNGKKAADGDYAYDYYHKVGEMRVRN